MSKNHVIVVLSDGETWMTLTGSSLVVVSDEEFKDLCLGQTDVRDLHPLVEIGLTEFNNA